MVCVTEPDDPLKDVLDYKDVSALSGFTEVNLRQMYFRGQLPPELQPRKGKRPLWSRASIESWLTTR